MRVCLAGATGGVGRCLAAAILDRDGLVLRNAVARRAAGQDIGTVLGRELSGICVTDDLHRLLDGSDTRDEVMAAIRALIDRIVVTPENDDLRVDLHGELATILQFASAKQNPATEVRDGLA